MELQPCCGKRSGIGAYTYELAKRLKSGDGLEFCGNVFNFAGRNDNSQALEGIFMPIRESRLLPYGVYRRIWDIVPVRYDSLFPRGTDLTVFFNYIVPPRIEGQVMTAVHDMTYLRYPETMAAQNLRRIRRGIRYSVERSSRILTVSEFSRGEIAELLGVPWEKIEVVYPAPPLRPGPADFEGCVRKWGLRRPYLLFVGTIEPRKNIARLLRAFALLKEKDRIPHQLVLAGGRGWRDEEIMETARGIRHGGDVIFTGYVSGDEKSALYRNAEVFVFPSLYEGFGIPPLEAMAHGCPVVCANAASLPEVVGAAAELVDPLDAEGIAEGLRRVISDRGYAGNLREKGRIQARKYTWESSAERLRALCKEIGS